MRYFPTRSDDHINVRVIKHYGTYSIHVQGAFIRWIHPRLNEKKKQQQLVNKVDVHFMCVCVDVWGREEDSVPCLRWDLSLSILAMFRGSCHSLYPIYLRLCYYRLVSAIHCDIPNLPANAVSTWSSLDVNSTVTYTCQTGYYVLELRALCQHATCSLSEDGLRGQWTDIFNCSGI